MDQNPVAPFDMYADEVILWMEQQKKDKQSTKAKLILTIICILVVTLAAALFYVPYFVNGRDLVVSLALPFIFVGIPMLLFFLILHDLKEGKTIYYVTNYRVITSKNGKKPIVRYSYIADLKDYKIINNDNGEISVEFELIYGGDNSQECYDFFNIDNAQEATMIIDEIKAEQENNFVTYDFVAQ